jgi:hypothetical protein
MPRRTTSRILFGTDLALLAAFSFACIASQFLGYSASVRAGDRAVVFDTVRGELSLWTARVRPSHLPAARQVFYDSVNSSTVAEIFQSPHNPIDRAWIWFGFGYARGTEIYYAPPVVAGDFAHVLVAPYWFFIAVLSIWPVRRIARRLDGERTMRRLSLGLCPVCGYDLRGRALRCPGCGSASPFGEEPQPSESPRPTAAELPAVAHDAVAADDLIKTA